jgi:hypothetical protein
MRRAFADTCYYLALLNADDELHELATELTPDMSGELITTAWVLTEVLDALSSPPHRAAAVQFIRDCRAHRGVTVVPPSERLFDLGFDLFAQRPDKDWSFTDCISFVVMTEHGLTDALSADHHFEQAGFNALLK